MDAKESMEIPGVGLVSFNHARDEFGRVTVLHRVHAEPERAHQLARLTSTSAFQDCRIAFTEWGLPEAIQTEKYLVLYKKGAGQKPPGHVNR